MPELYDEQAELDAVYCDRCGTHHSDPGSCDNDEEVEDTAVEVHKPIQLDTLEEIGPDAYEVKFALLECRTCRERGPIARADNHTAEGGMFDVDHAKATGHRNYYLFTITRNTAQVYL
ncbi:hypothetical protein [Nocardia pseudovaccinii]|uniref:hypothetical protein n=1 Tax=Nocardia pseudovaccinii TaxID=189540 RepID=UPI0007A527C9|nr:hypothetical protein [Nocardia pseudovaccinii]